MFYAECRRVRPARCVKFDGPPSSHRVETTNLIIRLIVYRSLARASIIVTVSSARSRSLIHETDVIVLSLLVTAAILIILSALPISGALGLVIVIDSTDVSSAAGSLTAEFIKQPLVKSADHVTMTDHESTHSVFMPYKSPDSSAVRKLGSALQETGKNPGL